MVNLKYICAVTFCLIGGNLAAQELSDVELLEQLAQLEEELEEVSAQNAAAGDRGGRIGHFGGWLGYSGEYGALIGARLALEPFLDERQRLLLSAEKAELRNQLNFTFQRRLQSLSEPLFELGVNHESRDLGDVLDVKSESTSLQLGLAWQLNDSQRLGIYGLYSDDTLKDPGLGLSSYVLGQLGTSSRKAIGLRHNLTFGEKTGIRGQLALRQEFGSRDGGHDYQLSEVTLDLRDDYAGGLSFDLQARAGLLRGTHGAIEYIGDRFFYGSSLVRGFGMGGMGPRDLSSPDQSALGGDQYAALRLDLGKRGPFDLGERVTLGAFMDAGVLSTRHSATGIERGTDLRASVGLSIGLDTDMGRITIEAAHPFKKQAWDETRMLGISMRASF